MLEIRLATLADLGALTSMLQEMDEFYEESERESDELKASQIKEALFAEHQHAYVIIANEGLRAIGLASYSYLWPAVLGTKSLYLKELYVAKSGRRLGVGKALMRELHAIALRSNCSRIEWTTDSDNADAQRFYEALGFSAQPSKVFYRSTVSPTGS